MDGNETSNKIYMIFFTNLFHAIYLVRSQQARYSLTHEEKKNEVKLWCNLSCSGKEMSIFKNCALCSNLHDILEVSPKIE